MAATSIGAVPTGTFASDPLGGAPSPTATISLSVSPTSVSTCETMTVTWNITNASGLDDTSELRLFYSNVGILQPLGSTPPTTQGLITNAAMRSQSVVWNPVSLSNGGAYVIKGSGNTNPTPVVIDSPSFIVTVGDTSCLSGGSGGSGAPSETPSPTSPPADSIPVTSSPTPAVSSSKQGSNTGAIVGGTIAGIAVIGLVIVFLFWKKRQALLSKATQRNASKHGHHKWGGLASIDKTHGEIPVAMSPNSPYGKQAYGRSQSTARAMTEEEAMEKGYTEDDHTIVPDVPELPKHDRKSRRYSSEILAAALKDDSGLAAFNEQYAHYPATTKVPVLSTTSPTTAGPDDPFTDDAFIARGKRASSLSVPSTARTQSRVSDVPSTRGPPSPLPLPSSAGYQATPPSSMQTQHALASIARAASASATVSRPTRKPVPRYREDSIELTNTSRSSPTSQSRRGSGNMPTTPDSSSPEGMNDKLSASAGSTASHWLQERAPMANRHIGLAGQNEGPVHYLIPDPPPQSRH